MASNDQNTVELIAEATAYRAAYKLVLEALSGLISVHASEVRFSLSEAMAKRLHQKKGEYLFHAPMELSDELQSVGNRTFQKVFTELSGEIVESMKASKS